jgi:surfeit locus 1 family protein
MTEQKGRRVFRPGLWLTVATAAAFAVLTGLGVWQLQRLEWKRGLIAELEARHDAPPITRLPQAPLDLAALEHRHVLLKGRFLASPEFHLPGHSYQGVTGLQIALPFVLDDGRAVIVDRGWIPLNQQDPARREFSTPEGEVPLEGLLRRDGWRGSELFRAENDPVGNNWYYVDTEAMAARAGLENPLQGLYVIETGKRDAGLPIPAEARISLPNNHLQYALTWFALALALLVIYLLKSLRREPSEEEKA